jgi:toxin ParE1/3/4
VGVYELSSLAESDLDSIGSYTVENWGAAQAVRYLADLEDCCQLLADSPGLGRSCDDILPGLFRQEQGKHVVFFRRTASGVRVLRFLHERMLPELHLFEDDDEY